MGMPRQDRVRRRPKFSPTLRDCYSVATETACSYKYGLLSIVRRAGVVSDDTCVRIYVCSVRAQVQIHGQLSIARDVLVLSAPGKCDAASADLLSKVRQCNILFTSLQHIAFIIATYSSNHCNIPLTLLQHTP